MEQIHYGHWSSTAYTVDSIKNITMNRSDSSGLLSFMAQQKSYRPQIKKKHMFPQLIGWNQPWRLVNTPWRCWPINLYASGRTKFHSWQKRHRIDLFLREIIVHTFRNGKHIWNVQEINSPDFHGRTWPSSLVAWLDHAIYQNYFGGLFMSQLK